MMRPRVFQQWYAPCSRSGAMRWRSTGAAIVVMLVSQGGFAAEGNSGPSAMTLEDALSYARQHQPSLRAAQARAAAADTARQIPRAQWFPKVGAVAEAFVATANNTTASYVAPSEMDLVRIGGTTATGTGTWDPSPSTLAALGVRQQVFDFGRIAAESAVFDATAQAESSHAKVTALDIDLGVRDAFYAVKTAKAILEAAEAAYTRDKENRDFFAAGVRGGLRPPVDLTRAEAELMRVDVGRIRARGAVVTAQGIFAAAVGVPELLLDATGEPPPPLLPPRIESALSDAQARDPGIAEAAARLKSQQALTSAYAYQFVPDLKFSGALSGRAGGAGFASSLPWGGGWAPDVPNWDLGVVLNWKWFDEGTLAERAVSAVEERAREEDLEEARLLETSHGEQAFSDATVAQMALPALEASLKAARDNYSQFQARFRVGLGTAVELADAESALTGAEIEYAIGKFDYARARARLSRALAEGQ